VPILVRVTHACSQCNKCERGTHAHQCVLVLSPIVFTSATFTIARLADRVHVLQNWFEELKRLALAE